MIQFFKKIRCFAVITALLLVLSGVCVRADAPYGEDAYAYMEYLQGWYPNRAVANPNLDNAAAWLKQQVTNMGYQYADQPFSIDIGNGIVINGENIIFSKKGASDRVIVVGAHYDSVLTNGTDDNATGVGVLMETAKRLASNSGLPYTVRFVLFSAEEPGCYGSQYYVDNLSQEERNRIICMFNIDTIGAGDYMYLYGGGLNEAGQPIRTWAVEQTLQAAGNLGLSMSYHPNVNAQFPVPVKHTASDQQAFDRAGIPYVYFEASNWNGGPMTNFYQTSNPAVENGKMMHVAAYENLAFYNQTFGNRIKEHLTAYSKLLDYMLNNLIPDTGAISYSYEERSETVWAVSDVRIRSAASTGSETLDVLRAGESIPRTGYHEEWCRVLFNGQEAFIKTEYLTAENPNPEPSTEEIPTEAFTEAEEEEESFGETSAAVTTTGFETTVSETTESETTVSTSAASTTAAPVIEKEEQAGNGNSLSGMQFLDSVTEWMQGNQNVQIILIGAIVLVAILLCVLVFLIQQLRK
ncbi:MAG: M20/M25/M40 family metallo-hydrolase [Lachnospiraceae bacterium]|nr:M20/M25/M40 family metallo-hydrolase [Lachnospiraceae bacterium]